MLCCHTVSWRSEFNTPSNCHRSRSTKTASLLPHTTVMSWMQHGLVACMPHNLLGPCPLYNHPLPTHLQWAASMSLQGCPSAVHQGVSLITPKLEPQRLASLCPPHWPPLGHKHEGSTPVTTACNPHWLPTQQLQGLAVRAHKEWVWVFELLGLREDACQHVSR
jgi:hypothetical protein